MTAKVPGWKVAHQFVDGKHRICVWNEDEKKYFAVSATPDEPLPMPPPGALIAFHALGPVWSLPSFRTIALGMPE